jgi:hypothetical protein
VSSVTSSRSRPNSAGRLCQAGARRPHSWSDRLQIPGP